MSGGGKNPPKNEENFSKMKEKMQRFFGFGKSSSHLPIPKSISKEIHLTPEVLKEIGPESPANNRLKTIEALCDVVKHKQLEENALEALWYRIHDLVEGEGLQVENRRIALNFLLCLLEGQASNMTIMREHMFRVIRNMTDLADIQYRLKLFSVLSDKGKNLLYFEDETGKFMLEWMPDVMSYGHIASFLPIILNIVKYNAAYLDEDVLSNLVQEICMIPNRTRSEEELSLCLSVLHAVICYSYLPSDALYHFIAACCHTVNNSNICEKSWELMRQLLGTYLGHSAIYTMCCILQDKRQPVDVLLLRGSIFFSGMALWGSRKVDSLKHTFSSVLPSFREALAHENSLIAYEVVLNMNRLVTKYGKDLHHVTWEIILDILEKLLHQVDKCKFEEKISKETHGVITATEYLHSTRLFFGPTARLFHIVEMCATKRPSKSVMVLIDYHTQFIHPGRENWLDKLTKLMEKYLWGQSRTEIRIKALDVLSLVLSVNTHVYEKELIEQVVIPILSPLDSDTDSQVRCKGVELLLSLCEDCSSNHFFELCAIVEKMLKRSLASPPTETDKTEEASILDVKTAVIKIVEVFKIKLYTAPASHCQKLFELLTSHLTHQYSHLYLGHTACIIRKTVFTLLLKLRADSATHIGLADRKPGNRFVYSPYVLCRASDTDDAELLLPRSPALPGLSPSQMYCVLDYQQAFKLILTCLEREKDWVVLQVVLEKLQQLLENKTLILSVDRLLVDSLCSKLCTMVKDRRLDPSQKLINRPTSFTRSDFHTYVFPVLAAMVTYHTVLEKSRLREIISCLEFGLVSKCAKACVTTLRICSLEVKEVMMRQLPSVLLSLSKISATMSMAIPVLAFLSSIVRIPKLYVNFVEDQYMSVFAIALPYTNPFKFSHYAVSLAHHVIGVWFIRCRLPFRRGFVKYIQRGLKYNVLQLFEDNAIRHLNSQNTDSSDRIRSGSLNEASRRRRNMSGIEGVKRNNRVPMDEKMSQFHKELTETCMDMMSRYAFGNFSPVPKRSEIAEFLLKDGQTDTWVVGNKVVTITTSGNPNRPGGMCDKCLTALNESREKQRLPRTQSVSVPASSRADRRRHKSMAAIGSEGTSVLETEDTMLPRRSLDDMSLPLIEAGGRDDVAVQTGSSLTANTGDLYDMDDPFVADRPPELKTLLTLQCSCWCTNWAEVYIRGASGDVSWMMRIENETGTYRTQNPSLFDITRLLAPLSCRTPDCESGGGKIDIGSLCEEEYETLHSQHFSQTQTSAFEKEVDNIQSSKESEVPKSTDKKREEDYESRSSLRRISSSPSLTSGSHNEQSPQELIKEDLFSSEKKHESKHIKRIQTKHSKVRSGAEDFSNAGHLESTTSSEASLEPLKKLSDLTQRLEKNEMEKKSSEIQSTGNRKSRQENLSEPGNKFGKSGNKADEKKPAQRSLSEDLDGKRRPQALKLTSQGASKTPGLVSLSEAGSSDNLQTKRRGHTISVMSSGTEPRLRDDFDSQSRGSMASVDGREGLNPTYVFLQLYQCHPLLTSQDVPLHVPDNSMFRNSISRLDHIYPCETHKIGVLYMGKNQQSDERTLLSNEFGSERYIQFIQGLGEMISIEEAERDKVYLGGLTTSDGKFAVTWHDENLRVIFHVATLMPTEERDTRFTNKKSHIGNDYVTIVYNDSSEDYKTGTISGQFNFVSIVIRPLDHQSNAVSLLTKDGSCVIFTFTDIADILGHTHTKIISDSNLPLLVRQIALHCNLGSMVLQRQQSSVPEVFASNWLERLRHIKRLKQRLVEAKSEQALQPSSPTHVWPPTGASGDGCVSGYEDFTDFV